MSALDDRAAASAARRNDPRLLWPDLDVEAFSDARVRITSVVRDVLASVGQATLEAPNDDAVTLGRAAYRLGVGALLGAWIESRRVRASHAVAELLRTHWAHGRRRQERMVERLRFVADALRAEGVEFVLLKGLDSARLYPAGARVFQDLDLFMPVRHSAAVELTLARLGLLPGPMRDGRRRDWTAPRAALESLEFVHEDNAWGVDVHHGLSRYFHLALRADVPDPDLQSCEFVLMSGVRVFVLSPALRLAFLAVNASSSLKVLQLTHLMDIVLSARAAPSETWGELESLLARAGSARFAYIPFLLAQQLAPGAIPDDVLSRIAASVPDRLRRAAEGLSLWNLETAGELLRGHAFVWARGPRDVATVVWCQSMPRVYRAWRERRSLARGAEV